MATSKPTKRERVLMRALAVERENGNAAFARLRETRAAVDRLTAQLHERDNYIETLKQAVNANAKEVGRLQKERDLAVADDTDSCADRDAWKSKAENQKARAEHFRQQREVLLDMMMVCAEKLPWETHS